MPSPEQLARHSLGIAEDTLALARDPRDRTALGYTRAGIAALNEGQVPSCFTWLSLAENITTSDLVRQDLSTARSHLLDVWDV